MRVDICRLQTMGMGRLADKTSVPMLKAVDYLLALSYLYEGCGVIPVPVFAMAKALNSCIE